MKDDRHGGGFGRLRLFAASLWLSLATVILCSVVPAGAPRTTALGSAFNPSTIHVALAAPAKLRDALTPGDEDGARDDRAGGVSHDALPLIQLAAIPVPLATADGGPSPAGPIAAPVRPQRESAHPPRAPPLA